MAATHGTACLHHSSSFFLQSSFLGIFCCLCAALGDVKVKVLIAHLKFHCTRSCTLQLVWVARLLPAKDQGWPIYVILMEGGGGGSVELPFLA